MEKRKYIIIPGCSDLNRGDQALVWETKRLAESNGFIGEYYLTAEENEPTEQSKNEGLNIIKPIMEHPSRVYKDKTNIKYGLSLKLKWGIVELFDFLGSLFYFTKLTRKAAKIFISKKKRASLETFEECDAVFVKGGGLFQTYGGIESTYSMYFWCFHIFLAKALKKPIYVMPNSFGPFEGPFVKSIAKKAMASCSVVTARESFSAKMVEEQLNIKINVYPDLAFGLPASDISEKEIAARFDLPEDKKLAAITMRPYRFPLSENPEGAYETFKSEMRKFIRWLSQAGYMPVIVEHTLAVNAHENDAACIADVIEGLDKSEYRIISDRSFDCRDLKKIYGMCDYIVGTRFHSVIFSLASGVPGLAIYYVGNKGQGIMNDMGLSEYAVSIYDVSCDKLKEMFVKMVENREGVLNKIRNYTNGVALRYSELMKLCR